MINMYCKNCGQLIADNTAVCPYCSATVQGEANHSVNGTYYTPPENRQDSYQPQGEQYGNYYNQPNNQYGFNQYFKEAEANIESANTLGIISIILGILLSPIVGIICAAVGLSKLSSVPEIPELYTKRQQAKRLNNLGIIIPLVIWLVAFVAIMLFMGVFVAGTVYG